MADVKGGEGRRLRVAWVDRDRRSRHPDVPQPDFEIPYLTELLTLLQWERTYNYERFSLALQGRTPAEKLAGVLPASAA